MSDFLLSTLSHELDQVIDRFKPQLNAIMAKSGQPEQQIEPQQKARSGQPKIGLRDKPIINRVNPMTGRVINSTKNQEPEERQQVPGWRGLRGLGRWLWKGYSKDNPDYSHLYSNEHRITLEQYSQQTQHLREFANELINERYGNLQGGRDLDRLLTQMSAAIITWLRTSPTVRQYANLTKPANTPSAPTSKPNQVGSPPSQPKPEEQPEPIAAEPTSVQPAENPTASTEQPERKKRTPKPDAPGRFDSWMTPFGVRTEAIPKALTYLVNKGIDILNPAAVKQALQAVSNYRGNGDLALRFIKNYNKTSKFPIPLDDSQKVKAFLGTVGYDGNGVIPPEMFADPKAAPMPTGETKPAEQPAAKPEEPKAEVEPMPEERPDAEEPKDEPAPSPEDTRAKSVYDVDPKSDELEIGSDKPEKPKATSMKDMLAAHKAKTQEEPEGTLDKQAIEAGKKPVSPEERERFQAATDAGDTARKVAALEKKPTTPEKKEEPKPEPAKDLRAEDWVNLPPKEKEKGWLRMSDEEKQKIRDGYVEDIAARKEQRSKRRKEPKTEGITALKNKYLALLRS